jgi:hypothetical protein
MINLLIIYCALSNLFAELVGMKETVNKEKFHVMSNVDEIILDGRNIYSADDYKVESSNLKVFGNSSVITCEELTSEFLFLVGNSSIDLSAIIFDLLIGFKLAFVDESLF